MIKVAIVTSTGGSVMNASLKLPYIKTRINTVLSDRGCEAINVARDHGIITKVFATKDAINFSDRLSAFFSESPHDLVISFYTKLFHGRLLDQLKGKFINFHPSILPACPGMDGFGDTIKSGSKFIGATVHYIDSGVDSGFPIIQSALPYNPSVSLKENRHAIFIAQCKMLIQVVKWYEDDRIRTDEAGRPVLFAGQYLSGEFAPNLDFPLAIDFST